MSNENLIPISVSAEYICEFTSHSQWINKASSWIGRYAKSEKIICIDADGFSCNIGQDFRYADENNLFPLKCYRLLRVIEREDKP